MKLISRCPKDLIDIGLTAGVAASFTRANWELDKLNGFVKDLDRGFCGCVFTDKGLVGDFYISEFVISPKSFRSLSYVLDWLTRVATPADLSNC